VTVHWFEDYFRILLQGREKITSWC
jgi:hypothetical protein